MAERAPAPRGGAQVSGARLAGFAGSQEQSPHQGRLLLPRFPGQGLLAQKWSSAEGWGLLSSHPALSLSQMSQYLFRVTSAGAKKQRDPDDLLSQHRGNWSVDIWFSI